jgi:hypothetical protein
MSKILFAVLATTCVLLNAVNTSVVAKTLTQHTIAMNNAEVEIEKGDASWTVSEYEKWYNDNYGKKITSCFNIAKRNGQDDCSYLRVVDDCFAGHVCDNPNRQEFALYT